MFYQIVTKSQKHCDLFSIKFKILWNYDLFFLHEARGGHPRFVGNNTFILNQYGSNRELKSTPKMKSTPLFAVKDPSLMLVLNKSLSTRSLPGLSAWTMGYCARKCVYVHVCAHDEQKRQA